MLTKIETPLISSSIPGSEEQLNPNLLIKPSKKEGNKIGLKRLFDYYKTIGYYQIASKFQDYDNNEKLVLGYINPSDYGIGNEHSERYSIIDSLDQTDGCETEGTILHFYPIIPNIHDTIVNDLNRRYIKSFPKAVDQESTNEKIQLKKQEVLNFLVSQIKQRYDTETIEMINQLPPEQREQGGQEIYQQRSQMFEKLPEIQKLYSKDFKLPIEKWAGRIDYLNDKRFEMDIISRKLFSDQFKYNERYIEIQLLGDSYKPKVIDPKYAFTLKSETVEDVSDASMFGYLEFEDLNGVINKYGNLMTDKQIERLNQWTPYNIYTNLISEHDKHFMEFKHHRQEKNINNYFVMKKMMSQHNLHKLRINNNRDENYIEICHIYMLVPRKQGKLTAIYSKDNPEIFVAPTPITEDFIVTVKPEYISNTDRTASTLKYGEHIDWYYVNEVYHCIEICPLFGGTHYTLHSDNKFSRIFIKLDKLDYQFKSEIGDYVCKIPVHGGKLKGPSDTERLKPFQLDYNYLWNKIRELVITELMPFHLIDERLVNGQSLEDSMSQDTLLKFMDITQNVGLGPVNPSSENTGVQPGQLYPYATTVNLSRAEAISTRIGLAEKIKQNAWETLGVSSQFLGQIGSTETATGITQGINRSITQIQHRYDLHYSMMNKAKLTMLDAEQYLFVKSPKEQIEFLTDDFTSEIIRLNKGDISISRKLSMYYESSARETESFELLKQMAMNDNTIDYYERGLTINSKTSGEILERLKENRDKLAQQQESQYTAQQEMQQKEIEAQNKSLELQQQFEAEQNQLDRETEIIVAQIRALGFSNEPDTNNNSQFDVNELAKSELERNKLDHLKETNRLKQDSEKTKMFNDLSQKQQELMMKKQDNLTKYNIELKKLENQRYLKNIDLQIAKYGDKGKYSNSKKKKK